MPLPTYTELAAALTKFFTASDKAHDIVNGPASGTGSTITVESGVIPTFAKAIADFEASGGGTGTFPLVNLGTFSGATTNYMLPNNASGAQFFIYENSTITLPDANIGTDLTFSFYVMIGTKVPTFVSDVNVILPDSFTAFPSTIGKGYIVRALYCTGSITGGYWLIEISPVFTPPVQDP